jgi:hypothetical protein
MEMGPGGASAHSNVADDLTRTDWLTDHQENWTAGVGTTADLPGQVAVEVLVIPRTDYHAEATTAIVDHRLHSAAPPAADR